MHTPSYVLGADPGKSGAIALLEIDEKMELTGKMELVPVRLKDGHMDVGWMVNKLKVYMCRVVAAYQEHVHAIFGSSAKGSFEFGDSNGSMRTLLECMLSIYRDGDVKVETVAPKRWQSVAWKGVEPIAEPVVDRDTKKPILLKNGKQKVKVDTKATSSVAAHLIFPNQSFVMPRCKNEHDGCVDAALIAYYGHSRFSSDQGSCLSRRLQSVVRVCDRSSRKR